MKSDEDKLYVKIVELDEIYKFVINNCHLTSFINLNIRYKYHICFNKILDQRFK